MERITKLRMKDDNGDFPNTYPIGAEAENIIFDNGENLEILFNRYLQIFAVLDNADEDGQMLYSAFNTAYRKDTENSSIMVDENLIIQDDETLYLISKYFDIEDNDTGNQTLVINIKDNY